MTDPASQQKAQMMEEIQSIKKIIYQKKPVLNTVLHPKHLKLVMLLTGISISLFSLVLYSLEQRYGSYGLLPASIKKVYTWLAALIGAALYVLFFVLWLRSLKKSGSNLTGEHFWSALFSFRVVNITLPVRVLSFILFIYFIQHKMTYYIIPVLSIEMGLLFNFFGCITETKNYIIGGYWFLITAAVIFLYPLIPGSLAVFLSVGCGSLLFGLLPNPGKLSDDRL